MFGKRRNIKLPIESDDKVWLEDSLIWFEERLGKHFLINQPIILPNDDYFDWAFKGKENDAYRVLEKVAKVMNVDLRKISLVFYSEPSSIELSEGLMTVQGNYENTSGRYIEYSDGKIEIMIERKQLQDPTSLVATVAHEMAHVKLIGEKMIVENNEYLTELAVLVYGFGVFNANTSMIKMNTWSGMSYAGWQLVGGLGYLHFKIHAFALALLSNYRNDLNPAWSMYLERDLQRALKKSFEYIKANQDEIRFRA